MNSKNILKTAMVAALPGLMFAAGIGTANAKVVCNNERGDATRTELFYTIDRQNVSDASKACINTTPNATNSPGTYSTTWPTINNSGYMVAGKGWKTGTTTRKVGYNAGFLNFGGPGYLSVYGWARNGSDNKTVIEYYIVDSWGTQERPAFGTSLGSKRIDGALYRFYKTSQNAPNAYSGTNIPFTQYWSVRDTKVATGSGSANRTVNVGAHFSAWAAVKMPMPAEQGYQVVATEGYNGSAGGSNVTVWEAG
jgi:endo-1,4-beta-xylanase